LREQGSSIYAYLIDTYKRFGYHRNYLRSTIMQGAAGTAAMGQIQDILRTDPPESIGGLKVVEIDDYWDTAKFGEFKSETDRSSRNLISMKFEGGLKAIIRPSGTEPKNKVYLEKRSEPVGVEASDEEFEAVRRRVDTEVREFSNAFMKMMLGLIGVSLPGYAMEISDLVALERKQHFVETFVPEFTERAKALAGGEPDAQALGSWIDAELKSYGPDARLLVGRGFRAYLNEQRTNGSGDSKVLSLQEQIFFS
jgi:hypothetical protein